MKKLLKSLPPIRLAFEIRDRLVHIEQKVDRILPTSSPSESVSIYSGSSDQAFGPTTFAQSGEDLVVVNTFCLLGNFTPSYLDIGANHPWDCNNTALLYRRGARGVSIDANPDAVNLFKRERPDDVVVNVGAGPKQGMMTFYRFDKMSGRNSFSKEMVDQFKEIAPTARLNDTINIEVMTLNQIVDKFCGGKFPDFLSVDAEGLDYDLIDAADFSVTRPTMICVETRNGRGDDVTSQIAPLVKSKGYVPLVRTWGNAFFLSLDAHDKLKF